VIFIHGLSVPSESYLLSEIHSYYTNEGFRFLTFDLYGRGYSDAPDTRYTPALFAGQLQELLFALNISEPFCLMGLSMGGGIASYYAKIYPDRVKKLVLISSVGKGTGGQTFLPLLKIPIFGDFVFKLVIKKYYLKVYAKEWESVESNDFKLCYEAAKRHIEENQGLFRSVLSTLKFFPLGDMVEVFQEIASHSRKVLIVHGDKDTTVPYSSALTLKRILFNASMLSINGGLHNIIVERKDEVHPKIVTFLKNCIND
jgi:pimeloyl-ACP methyl ester carboxylesterase